MQPRGMPASQVQGGFQSCQHLSRLGCLSGQPLPFQPFDQGTLTCNASFPLTDMPVGQSEKVFRLSHIVSPLGLNPIKTNGT